MFLGQKIDTIKMSRSILAQQISSSSMTLEEHPISLFYEEPWSEPPAVVRESSRSFLPQQQQELLSNNNNSDNNNNARENMEQGKKNHDNNNFSHPDDCTDTNNTDPSNQLRLRAVKLVACLREAMKPLKEKLLNLHEWNELKDPNTEEIRTRLLLALEYLQLMEIDLLTQFDDDDDDRRGDNKNKTISNPSHLPSLGDIVRKVQKILMSSNPAG